MISVFALTFQNVGNGISAGYFIYHVMGRLFPSEVGLQIGLEIEFPSEIPFPEIPFPT